MYSYSCQLKVWVGNVSSQVGVIDSLFNNFQKESGSTDNEVG